MGIKFANSAFATLAAGIASGATSITLTTGQGARFPSLGAGDYFYATLIDASNNLEIVKCTARSTDVLTVTRAQEGTTARAYSAGDRIELRVTAAGLTDLISGLDGDRGDITVSGSGLVWTIDNLAVTDAKINSMAATKLTGTIDTARMYSGAVIQTVQATYSTRTSMSMTASRTIIWDAITFTKLKSNSKLRISLILPFGGSGASYPHFADAFIRLSTSGYGVNGSDIHGYIHNTRATSNNMGAIWVADFLYDTTSTNISGTGSVYVNLGYQSADAGGLHPAPIWNPNASEDTRSWQSASNIIIQEIA